MAAISLFLFLSPFFCGANGEQLQKYFSKLSGLEDVIFTSDVAFSLAARSILDCGQLCGQTTGCISFTYAKTSAACTGHSKLMTSLDSSLVEPGTRAFGCMECATTVTAVLVPETTSPSATNSESITSLTTARETSLAITVEDTTTSVSGTVCDDSWLYQACSGSIKCPTIDGIWCVKSQCICEPGYFYSVSSCSCLSTCEDSSLQNTYITYVGSAIVDDLHFYETPTATAQLCMDLCSGNSTCKVAQWYTATSACQLVEYTVLTIQGQSSFDDSLDGSADMYQKMCA